MTLVFGAEVKSSPVLETGEDPYFQLLRPSPAKLSISPSGEYLAYVTLTMTGDTETAAQVEVVKLMQRGTTEGYPTPLAPWADMIAPTPH